MNQRSFDELRIEDAEAIAQRLQQDRKLCDEKKIPSSLALRLPSPPSALLDAVAQHLTPQADVQKDLQRLRCQGTIQNIRTYLEQLNDVAGTPEDTLGSGKAYIPTTEEFEASLKVLGYLQDETSGVNLQSTSQLRDVLAAVQRQLAISGETRAQYSKAARTGKPKAGDKQRSRRCYMCRRHYSTQQSLSSYPSLCNSCGVFNLSSSRLSLPDKLNLTGKVALVTGGRINLGYHTALRLLRCGSRVIVSSRYPADASIRYSNEPDYEQWKPRLKVVGADFRTAKDAFRLVHVVKELLSAWDQSSESPKQQYLDILINNAAQTLTDPVKAEMKAISRETQLKALPPAQALVADGPDSGYLPRLRGGTHASWIPSIENGTEQLQIEDTKSQTLTQKGLRTTSDNEVGKSSWTQDLQEIPYEDLISAHSVNAFVPLILCRELLPCMGTDDVESLTVPAGHIINVSSREGILEDKVNSASKMGHHVHTNMSKAAINMITETEASVAWKKRRVAMNSVDPGYMTAAPECQPVDGCPIGFEDGAARVLWPIVVAEREGRVIWGRFMKHFETGTPVIWRGN